jgi:hypothetical protein
MRAVVITISQARVDADCVMIIGYVAVKQIRCKTRIVDLP